MALIVGSLWLTFCCREQGNSDAAAVFPTEGTISRFRTGIELSDSFSDGKSILDKDGLNVESAAPSFETETAQVKANSQAVRGRQSQSGPLTPGIVLGQTSMERGRVSERLILINH